jgi:hypothetical protein
LTWFTGVATGKSAGGSDLPGIDPVIQGGDAERVGQLDFED